MKKIAFVMFLILAGSANAGYSAGVVSKLYAHANDVALFAAGTHADKPACSTAGDEWSISLATPTGRAMYAMLLSAQARGKSVTVSGSGTCSAWGDRETPWYIYSVD